MPLKIECPSCSIILTIPFRRIDTRVRCPKCQKAFVVRDPEESKKPTAQPKPTKKEPPKKEPPKKEPPKKEPPKKEPIVKKEPPKKEPPKKEPIVKKEPPKKEPIVKKEPVTQEKPKTSPKPPPLPRSKPKQETFKTPPRPKEPTESEPAEKPTASQSSSPLPQDERPPEESPATEEENTEAEKPPERPGYSPDADKRAGARLWATMLVLTGFLGAIPAILHMVEVIRNEEIDEAARWSVLLLGGGVWLLAYAAYVAQLPDWSVIWTATAAVLVLAAGYALGLGLTLWAGPENDWIQWLNLENKLRNKHAAGWCFVMLCATGLLAYWGGRFAARWKRGYWLLIRSMTRRG